MSLKWEYFSRKALQVVHMLFHKLANFLTNPLFPIFLIFLKIWAQLRWRDGTILHQGKTLRASSYVSLHNFSNLSMSTVKVEFTILQIREQFSISCSHRAFSSPSNWNKKEALHANMCKEMWIFSSKLLMDFEMVWKFLLDLNFNLRIQLFS